MIVCLCKGVCSRTVRAAIDAGADDVPSIAEACGAGSDCGACHEELRGMVAEARDDKSARRSLPLIPPSFRAA